MRYLILVVLSLSLFPSTSQAMFGFDFDGVVTGYGNGQPAPDDRVGKTYTGSIQFDETATFVPRVITNPGWAHYQANGNFLVDFGDRRLVKSGVLDITIHQSLEPNTRDNVQVKIYDGLFSDTGEQGFGWWSWSYPPDTFQDTSYANLNRPDSIAGSLGLTAHYVGGEVWDVYDTRSEFTMTGYHAADNQPYSYQELTSGDQPYLVHKSENTASGPLTERAGNVAMAGFGAVGLGGLLSLASKGLLA